MRKFFYARVSSKDQSLDRQVIQAKELGIEDDFIFLETANGKDFKRPEYQLLKRMDLCQYLGHKKSNFLGCIFN